MITVLRIGHRLGRDARISTHCGLVARALGAQKIIYTGDKDENMMKNIRDVVGVWGGPFAVAYEKKWQTVLDAFPGTTVHLTMYGLPVQEKIKELHAKKNELLVIVGGEKVPSEVYHTVDFNIAVTGQPHSEIAALGIFLHELLQGTELQKTFQGATRYVIPQERGKKIVEK